MMEIMGIRRIANRAFMLSRQFMSLPQAIELVASEDKLKQFNLQKIYKMEPYQLIGGVNFFCTGLAESIDKMQNIDKALKFMEVLQKTTPGNPFIQYLTKKIALWLGFEDAEQFLSAIPMAPQGGMPQGAPVPPGVPPGMPMPPQGMPPVPPNQMPMVRPGMPPQGGPMPQQGQGLPPQLLMQIISQMQQGRRI
jgi:hypothetical protein